MATRRQTPSADKAAANQAVIKSLLKLPGNKFCADCKQNKLPRWASWNLGIFICIRYQAATQVLEEKRRSQLKFMPMQRRLIIMGRCRCSGFHRGMGTHISRVKSVDLDSWTDEQLANMVKWGNSRANKYWEANLAPGHVPSEAKIENFIRTKYETKRWVMDGGIPDPATLGDSEDEEVVVKQQLENRQSTSPTAVPERSASAPPKKSAVNLFDDAPEPEKPTSHSGGLRNQIAAKADPAPPKSSKPGDSLLGLDDFFGPPQQATPRQDLVSSTPAGAKSTRPDLKTSILSLYSSAPKQPVRPMHQSNPSFGSSASPQMQHSAFNDLNDAFSGLAFSSQPSQAQPQVSQPAKPNAFANLTSPLVSRSPPVAPQVTPASSGGFFGTQATKKPSSFSPGQSQTSAASGLNDLFALSSPPHVASTTAPKLAPTASFAFENAWATPSPAAPVSTQTTVWGASNSSIASNAFAGLGTSSIGNRIHDDDFGAFAVGTNNAKPDDDPFANVWK
ncbi:hypothetical protein BDZ91DRAFT_803279 [Kalaharituber pfeilii]|nr:hypothetical protein BDZ91DRAFT_803279 [Kalaharituber pfeilii]